MLTFAFHSSIFSLWGFDIPIMLPALLSGWLLDLLLGDPAWLPHPVVGFGKLIALGEHRLNKGCHRRLKGGLLAITLLLLLFTTTTIVRLLLGTWPVAVLLFDIIAVFFCLAGTTLIREVKAVFLALDRSLEEGRRQVSRIVGRDTAQLSAQEVRTAALETLAENLSDGVIAPLFWFLLLGTPGMLTYKMVNTLDSMIGYRTERYRLFGTVAARIDDVANFIPARLTALLMISLRPCLLPFVLRYGPQHASPNSGWPEAALAGTLDCRFGGPHNYFGQRFDKPYIGKNDRPLTTADMRRAVRVNRWTEMLMLIITACCLLMAPSLLECSTAASLALATKKQGTSLAFSEIIINFADNKARNFKMKHITMTMAMTALLLGACARQGKNAETQNNDSATGVKVETKYATGFTVRDSANVRLVSVYTGEQFALVGADSISVPDRYTKIVVPIRRCICMTALQLSNFTALDAYDIVTGITGTKNLFNEDILHRVDNGSIVKIGMEGNFDPELVMAAHPDVIFISPFKRGGYEAIKESGITLVPHLGYKELSPLGQAEWVKFVGMFIGKSAEANDAFAGIESRYNGLKQRVDSLLQHDEQRPTVTSGEMHYGTWHAVGGKNYLAQIFRDAGGQYVIDDDETAGEDLEFEKMYALSANADYWRILNSHPAEDFSYADLETSEPRNSLLKAFREKKVIYCNMRTTPYYETSPVEPDVLLKDFVAIFHPELVEPDYAPKYYHLLK